MQMKPQSFSINNAKKTITLYTNVEQPATEKTLIEYYLNNGYMPMTDEKKKGKTVEQMRKELETDKETLAKFDDLYKTKGGFHSACALYTKWKKDNK